jgi:HK97 family phage portal protein
VGFLSRIFGFRNAVVVVAQPSGLTTATPDPSTLPAVIRATQLIAADIARLPIRIENAAGEVIDSPVLDLLNRDASRWQSSYEFKRYLTANALTSGNGIALIRRDADGRIVELQPVPTGAVSVEMTDEGTSYQVGSASRLSSDQVLHIGCYPDPLNPAWYVSPLDGADFAMRLAADQDAAHAALIKTGSMGKIAIKHPGALADESVEAIRDAWQTMHATADGASRPLILREGMTAEKLSQETSTSNLDSRRFSVQEIARAFGVPPEMLFQQAGGALASQAETARAYADGAIAAWAHAWEAELTRKLCAPGEFARIDVRPITRGSLKDQGTAWSKLVLAGIASPNDARLAIGLPPLEGLDVPTVSMPGGAAAAVGPDNVDTEGESNA